MAKRLLDIIGAITGLLLFFPLLTLMSIWIKLDSKGPIFFRQERVGRYGKPFRIHKFRTMIVNAESQGLPLTTSQDTRITQSGKFLRKYKLDELTQLIDVLKGDMSLVGPRPEVPKYVAHYPPELKKIVLSVKPGITDIASIEYRNENDILSNATDPEIAYIRQVLPVKLKYHRKYASEQSLLLDIYLIFKTVFLVFGRWMPDSLNLIGKLPRDQKRLAILAFDVITLPFAYWSALVLVEETFTPKIHNIWWIFPLIVLITIPIFIHMGLYRAVIRYMEDKSAYTILYGVTLSVLMLFVVVAVTQQLVSFHKGVFIIYWLAALVYIGGSRVMLRSYYRRTRHMNDFKEKVIIYGAGEAGIQLAIGMQAAGRKTPVAFVDDDQKLHGHEIGGIKIFSPNDLPRLIEDMHIDHIFLCITITSSERRAEILRHLQQLHLNVHIIPGVSEFIHGLGKQEN